MRRKKLIPTLILLVVSITLLYFSGVLFQIYQPTRHPSFVQYAGRPSESGHVPDWWDDNFVASDKVKIGDYTFKFKKFNRYWKFYGCKEYKINRESVGGDPKWWCVWECNDYPCRELNHRCEEVESWTDEYGCKVVKYKCKYAGGSNIKDCSCSWGLGGWCACKCKWDSRWSYGYSPRSNQVKRNKEGYFVLGGAIGGCVDPNGYVNWGPSYVVKIYKNGKLIETIGKDYGCGSNQTTSIIWKSEDGLIEAEFLNHHWYSYHNFWSSQNIFTLHLPPNAITFNITPPSTHYFQEEEAKLPVKIINNLPYTLTAKVYVKVCQPTFAGEYCKEFSTVKKLEKGENIIYYTIPTQYVVDKLKITPSLEVFFDLNEIEMEGLNGNPTEILDDNLNPCSKVFNGRTSLININLCKEKGYHLISLGRVSGNTTTIMINPKPLYIDVVDGECPEGYHLSPNKKYCLRDDLKELSCLQLGCPQIPNHTYICTSAGVCAEIVYVYQDCRQLGCPTINGTEGVCDESSGVCVYEFEKDKPVYINITCRENPSICPMGTTCDVKTGACVKTEIIEELVQCKKDEDCYIPCEGMTAKCVNNYCEYYGSCKPTYIYVNQTKIVYKKVGCKELGGDKACPPNYYCDEELNVCVRESNNTIPTFIKKYWVWLVGGIILLFTFALTKKF